MTEPSVAGEDVSPDNLELDRPVLVHADVDLDALRQWLLAGVRLFIREGADLPTRRAVEDEAQRVVLVAALRRRGSISGAAETLGTSRRALRDAMKRLGIYERWQARDGSLSAPEEGGEPRDEHRVDGRDEPRDEGRGPGAAADDPP